MVNSLTSPGRSISVLACAGKRGRSPHAAGKGRMLTPRHLATGDFLGLVAGPLHEALQGIKLGQTEGVVELGGVASAVFGALPELPAVDTAGKHAPVCLTLITEDGQFFPLEVFGTKRDDALDLVRLPFLPGTAVKPGFEVLSRRADPAHRLENRVGADPMRAVRIGQVAGYVDLSRL